MIIRSKERVRQTQEVFTPYELCLRMVRNIPKEKLRDPTTTYIDPSCGDGNFLCAIHQVLTEEYGQTSEDVMSRLTGIELMSDNAAEAKRRLPGAKIICADALKFEFNSW